MFVRLCPKLVGIATKLVRTPIIGRNRSNRPSWHQILMAGLRNPPLRSRAPTKILTGEAFRRRRSEGRTCKSKPMGKLAPAHAGHRANFGPNLAPIWSKSARSTRPNSAYRGQASATSDRIWAEFDPILAISAHFGAMLAGIRPSFGDFANMGRLAEDRGEVSAEIARASFRNGSWPA